MPFCRQCSVEFPNRVEVDGKFRVLHRRKFCLTCSPFGSHNTRVEVTPNISDTEAKNLSFHVKESFSLWEVFSKMGLSATGSGYRTLRRKVEFLGLDTSHFDPSVGRRRSGSSKSFSREDVFREGSSIGTSTLRRHILRDASFPYVCSVCGNNGTHNGIPLTLQIDHINGNRSDNQIHNLRLLCPNCHSQTPTYCRKNTKSPRSSSE